MKAFLQAREAFVHYLKWVDSGVEASNSRSGQEVGLNDLVENRWSSRHS